VNLTSPRELLTAILVCTAAGAVINASFAQGVKDAKSWHTDQLRQMGLNFRLYSEDHNDRLPLAMFRRAAPGNEWGIVDAVPSPANGLMNNPTWGDPRRINAVQSTWRNSIVPYGQFASNLPGAPLFRNSGDDFTQTPNVTHPTMNGFLHAFNSQAVNSPSVVPLLWPGAGRQNWEGRAWHSPYLNCSNATPCMFNPTGPPSTSYHNDRADGPMSSHPNMTYWIFGKLGPSIQVDTSLRMISMGERISPDAYTLEEATQAPFRQVNASGWPLNYWVCGPGHTAQSPVSGVWRQGAYACFFRPDRTEP
jgi:hypothetical protein